MLKETLVRLGFPVNQAIQDYQVFLDELVIEGIKELQVVLELVRKVLLVWMESKEKMGFRGFQEKQDKPESQVTLVVYNKLAIDFKIILVYNMMTFH